MHPAAACQPHALVTTLTHRARQPLTGWAVVAALVFTAPVLQAAPPPDDHPGIPIYNQHCKECHGDRGQGVEGIHDDILEGDRSIESLARRIERTMPEDEPELVVGDEARRVAEWMHAAFYSAEARARLAPSSTDLTRLTVEQHQRSLVDSLDRLRHGTPPAVGSERGLKAEYFATRQFNGDKERPEGGRFKRVDPAISFDFKDKSPLEEIIGTEEFSIRWQGVIIPEESGAHDFIVETRNGIRLYINNNEDPLIDGWVSSGAESRTERGRIHLVAGRPYTLKLEFFTYKEPAASVELRWRPPHGVEEPVPPHVLAPTLSHQALAIEVAFPADDSSDGYARGQTISATWYRATVEAATATAHTVLAQADHLANTKEDAPDRAERWRDLAADLAGIAFRRPLDDASRAELVDEVFAANEDPAEALKRVVIRLFTSPLFLYPEANHPALDGHTVAARLALFLWDSIPDAELARAAAEGRLTDPAEAARQARRMAKDPRTRAKLDGFFHHWLELHHAEELFKDPGLYSEFDVRVIADLRRSLRHFIEHIVWGGQPDYRRLLLAEELWLNRRLAAIYAPHLLEGEGAEEFPTDGFIAVRLDPRRHSGLVSHPFLLATHAYHNDTSPIHRGVFLTQSLAGRPLRPPPVATVFEDSHFDPSLTMREKVVEMTKDSSCMACHTLINPLGFSLENYDAIGRWRSVDHKGRPIDSSSDYTTDEGEKIHLAGARDVAAYVAGSDPAHRAFLRSLFHHLVKQPMEAYGSDRMNILHAGFQASGFSIVDAIEAIALTAAAQNIFDAPSSGSAGSP